MTEALTSLKSISDDTRIRLLLLLKDREACVCELMSVFNMAQSKLSHHLILLRDAGFLEDEKRGKWNYYKVNTKALSTVNRELLVLVSRLLADGDILERDTEALKVVKHRMQICC